MTTVEELEANRLSRAEFLRRTGIFGLGMAGLGSFVSACGGQDGGPGAEERPRSIELTVSHWPALAYSVPWAVAIEQGYLKEEGIDLKGFVGSEGGGTTVRNVVTGGLPLGAVATPASIQAYDAGAPLKIIAGAIQHTGEINFVTLPDRGIEKIEDVRGKRVGYTNPGSVTQALATLSLKSAGIDPATDVKMQAMGGLSEALTGLKEGAIDLAPHLLPSILTQKDENWQIVFWTNEVVPSFMQLDLIAGAQPIEEEPDLIGALVKIYQRGNEFVIENPEKAAAAWAKHSDVPEDAALQSLKQIKPETYFDIEISAEGLNTAVEAMKAVELLDQDAELDWEGMIDQRFLPEDKQVDLSELA